MAVVMNDGVLEISCEKPHEFVDLLSPIGGLFQGDRRNAYLFRGVSAANYALAPAAFRPSKRLWLNETVFTPPLPNAFYQCAAELETLMRFFDIAAREGIRLPEDSQALRSTLKEWKYRLQRGAVSPDPFVWPPEELYSLIALGQHYGVPTRALDWTSRGLVAAYFAAATADEQDATKRKLCVWAFDTRVLMSTSATLPPLVLATAPGADNQNLRAQHGYVLLYRPVVTGFDSPRDTPSYDSLFTGVAPRYLLPVFTKVTLAATLAEDLLVLLSMAGVSAARLFPGLWGVARELDEVTKRQAKPTYLPTNAATAIVREQISAISM